MLIEWLYQLKESIDKHGIRFGLIFALYAIYRKELRNSRLDQRDADIFHNQKLIMEKLGVGDQWRGQASPFQSTEVRNLKRLLHSSQAVKSRVYQQRRRVEKMKINKAWLSGVIAYLFGQLALKYGFTFNNEWADMIAEILITFVIPFVIAWMNKTKKGANPSVLTQYTNTFESNR